MVEARIDARKVKSPDGQTGDKNGTFVKLEDSFSFVFQMNFILCGQQNRQSEHDLPTALREYFLPA
eukprot:scaffold13321_cov193-Alexandrium_tamarense.AAC.4